MITIDCPLCAGQAATDEALTVVTCDDCGISAAIAADRDLALDAAA